MRPVDTSGVQPSSSAEAPLFCAADASKLAVVHREDEVSLWDLDRHTRTWLNVGPHVPAFGPPFLDVELVNGGLSVAILVAVLSQRRQGRAIKHTDDIPEFWGPERAFAVSFVDAPSGRFRRQVTLAGTERSGDLDDREDVSFVISSEAQHVAGFRAPRSRRDGPESRCATAADGADLGNGARKSDPRGSNREHARRRCGVFTGRDATCGA